MIYLLSIINGVEGAAVTLAIITMLASIVLGVALLVAVIDEEEDRAAMLGAFLRRTLAAGIAFLALSALIPSRDSIISAYLMVEGRKIVTADNAQNTTAEIVKRIDIVLARVGVKP